METIDRTSTIGDIVTFLPKASDLFKAYKIDFCCGGQRSLAEAVQERNLDEEEVLNKLNVLAQQASERLVQNWNEASYTDLIDHIVATHHAYLNEELPALSPFVTKILRVHGPTHPELSELHKLYNQLKVELEEHMLSEENEAFPIIKQLEQDANALDSGAIQDLFVHLEDEHTLAGDLLKQMREITRDYTLPEGACTTYRITFQRLEELEADLFEHIHLENNILFPSVKKQVSY